MTESSSPPTSAEHLLEVFQEIGRSLEIGRTADTILAGLRHVLPRCDRATLCSVALDGQTVICRRARGRDSLVPDVSGSDAGNSPPAESRGRCSTADGPSCSR